MHLKLIVVFWILNGVNCWSLSAKKQCFDPPLPDNMERKQTSKYQIAVSHRGTPEALDKFYFGDTLIYSCVRGYENVLERPQVRTTSDDENYGSYDNYYGSTQDETVIDIITCDWKGRWYGLKTYDLNFGECKAIICNATRFHDIRNGNITNYKESYRFLEKMELVCDEGYRQKDRINSVTCKSSSSFKEYELPNFGCEPILCVEPAAPINGHIRLDGLYVGDRALYECEAGFSLIGNNNWTCQLNGKWDHDCVICASDDSYCTPPCVPLGANMTFTENTTEQGAVLEFTCKSRGHYYGESKNRTCMKNKKWSGSPIDCLANADIPCGMTNPCLTEISDKKARLEQPARKGAWPWMVQLRRKYGYACGGSLINDQWILTAAKCVHRKDISEVHLRKLTLAQRDDYAVRYIQEQDIYIHKKYDDKKSPRDLYDIALVKLDKKITTTPEVLPVCLWNAKTKDEIDHMEYARFFESERRYGVVTGWGKSESNGFLTDTLKQMQMEIKPDNVCEENINAEHKKEINGTLMFCAGGKEKINGEYKIIDTCSGDTGGPFVVRNPLNENRYIQIGIVSFGFGCKQEGKFGFYTKLTEELLTWIEDTIYIAEREND